MVHILRKKRTDKAVIFESTSLASQEDKKRKFKITIKKFTRKKVTNSVDSGWEREFCPRIGSERVSGIPNEQKKEIRKFGVEDRFF